MYNNGNNLNVEPAKVAKGIVWAVAGIVLVIVSMAFIRPWYNVWSQEMEGKAEFAKAEQNRKIKIEEAKANLEAEKLNAQAEVERAKGAAEAIRIENGSITPTYIQYLWVRQNRNLCAHRNQFAHTRVDTSAENARIISVGQTCRQVSAASIARLRLRRRRYCCKP